MHDTVQHFQPIFAVQCPRCCAHHLEVAQQVGFNAGKPRPRCFQIVCLNGIGQILGLDVSVIAPFKLTFQNPRVLLPDMV